MTNPEETIGVAPAESNDLATSPAPRDSRRIKLIALVVGALVLGGLGRVMLSGGIGGTFLSDILPWLGGTSVTLHFGDGTDTYLVPVSRTLSGDAESPEGMVTALLDGPVAGTGLSNLMPPGTTAQSVVVDGRTIVLDLSAGYLQRTSLLADEALLQSLTSWPGVEEARITVDGAPLIVTDTTGHLLYFYDEGRDMLVASPVPATEVRDILSAYLAGPADSRLVGLPEDVEVLSFESDPRSGTLKVNMTYSESVRQLATNDGDAMRRILEGLIASLTTGFADTGYVYLDFEGHATLGLGQCANLLRRVQPPPEILNDERLLSPAAGA